MKHLKISLILICVFFLSSNSFSEEKTDCSKIKKNTGAGWLKSALCKRGSDKLDSEGNFKKGTFDILKILKKN